MGLTVIMEKIIKNESTTGTITSVSIFVTKMILITTKITASIIDTEFTEAVTFIKSITNVATLTTEEITIITQITDLLALLSVNSVGSISEASQGLIGNKGLVVQAISEDLSFEEQTKKAEEQLQTNRDNCKGMDEAAAELEKITSDESTVTIVCKDMFDDDCDNAADNSKSLMKLTTSITKTSANNLEDSTITTIATQIKELISSVTIITFEERKTLRSLIITIRSTVLIYVSQISIVESKKLEVGGALKFEGDSTTIDTVDVNDFEAQLTVLNAQVTNLFQIADSNDIGKHCEVLRYCY